MASRLVSDLVPAVARAAMAHIDLCRYDGIEIIDYCTYRSEKEQARLYEIGRTEPGRIVTYARPGKSFHQYRVARDIVPLVNGKAIWDDDVLWERVGRLGEAVGFEWSGRWERFRERPHFQITAGLRIDEISEMTSAQVENVIERWYKNHELLKTVELAEARLIGEKEII
ncbi:hypothetical protein MNBD_NITROSPINAE04-1965 [hydrothermal vent metagenome]|uniref:Peptidase M15C domain-containing protein n=1 Tax=hydrothermal vent metagenome TaxID=652676 RepID=A0A3B1C9M4_9ZZZZ